MLTLSNTARVDGYTLFRDLERRDGRLTYTSRVYALPDHPRLARDNEGGLLFDARRYRAAGGPAPASGGTLSLTTELGVVPEDRVRVLDEARSLFGTREVPELLPLPTVGGTVALTVAGESAPGEFLRATGGNGPLSFTGRERASFLVDLAPDAINLFWASLQSKVDVLHVRYQLDIVHALGDVVIRVWCEARAAYEAIAAGLASGGLPPGGVGATAKNLQLAGYEVQTERPLEAEERRRLDEIGATLLDQVLADALFVTSKALPSSPPSARPQLRPFSQAMAAQVNRTLTQSSPAPGTLVVEDLLSLEPYASELADHVRDIDVRGNDRVIDVLLPCTVNFTDDVIEKVKVTVTPLDPSSGTAPGEFLLQAGTNIARYRASLGQAADRRYRVDALVYYRGDTKPLARHYPESDAAVAPLDLDGVGSLTVDVALGDVPFDRVRQVRVEFVHLATGVAGVLTLAADRLSGRWRLVTGDTADLYRRRAIWILADDTRLEGPWEDASSRRWVVDAPGAVRQDASVTLISAGSFANVAQVLVELRAGPADPSARFAFTGPEQTKVWPRSAAAVGQQYERRDTVVDRDGTITEGAWLTDDAPVAVVRDRTSFTLQVLTRLLPIGPDVPLALLALEAAGPAGTTARNTLALRDQKDVSWTFRVTDPVQHRYRYQVTLVSRAGTRRTGDWQDGDTAILVVRPPA